MIGVGSCGISARIVLVNVTVVEVLGVEEVAVLTQRVKAPKMYEQVLTRSRSV